MGKVTIKVKGMSCGHCVSSIEGSVGKLTGVQSVKVNLSSGEVDLEFDPSVVHLNDIKETIDDQGYDVE
ncbi:copper chaperone CopZ [Metabacillus endolithicus]|uniref:Copper chaperone CopZ n=1 Tax=Metabacillus endolithicus TaxID=1535204 RepID=A0ABW5C1L4_9BACI|nr:copper chaperone CopZ [Metabacillus endolithicus]UPG62210.1 copper chaperone CopZ [Metabacillus endolithicus]